MKYDYSEVPEVNIVFNPATDDIINLLPFYKFLEEYGGTTFEAATRLEDKVNRWIRHDGNVDNTDIANTIIKLVYSLKMMSIHNVDIDLEPHEVDMVFNPATNEIINLLPFYSFLEEYNNGTALEAATRLEDKVNKWIINHEYIDDSDIAEIIIKLTCTLKMMSIHNLNRLDIERERKP